jgi:hypothetical protein
MQIYKIIINILLLFSHFSLRKPVCNKKITIADHAIDPFVDAINHRFICSPLLNRDC